MTRECMGTHTMPQGKGVDCTRLGPMTVTRPCKKAICPGVITCKQTAAPHLNEEVSVPTSPMSRTSPTTSCPSAVSQNLATPQRLSFGDLHEIPDVEREPTTPNTLATPNIDRPVPRSPVVFAPDRPTRERTQRKTYDASTGSYKQISS